MKGSLHGQISSMKEFFDRSTRVLEQGDSGYAPQSGLFTVSQHVAHVAQTVEWFMNGAFAPGGFSMDFENMDKEVRATTSLKAAREWFDRACKTAHNVIDQHSEAEWA